MKHLVTFQHEVDKAGKLTAVASETSLIRQRAHARNVSFSKLATAVNLPFSISTPR